MPFCCWSFIMRFKGLNYAAVLFVFWRCMLVFVIEVRKIVKRQADLMIMIGCFVGGLNEAFFNSFVRLAQERPVK